MSGQDREQVTATSRAMQEIYVPAQDGRGRIAYAVTDDGLAIAGVLARIMHHAERFHTSDWRRAGR